MFEQLRILTPTDCVRDRLARFYHWNEYTALNAAVRVARARRREIDINALAKWTQHESDPPHDFHAKFQEFSKRFHGKSTG